jgi:hypothetical protein
MNSPRAAVMISRRLSSTGFVILGQRNPPPPDGSSFLMEPIFKSGVKRAPAAAVISAGPGLLPARGVRIGGPDLTKRRSAAVVASARLAVAVPAAGRFRTRTIRTQSLGLTISQHSFLLLSGNSGVFPLV